MPDPTPVNIASHLPAMAARYPDTPALHVPLRRRLRLSASTTKYTTWTFRELDTRSNAAAAALREQGITEGMRTVLMVPPGLAFFTLVFALFRLGAVPVMIDPGMGLKNLRQCLDEAEPEGFVGITKAQWARRLFSWGKRTLKHCITVSDRTIARFGKPTDASIMATPDDAGGLAAILFTSGSTGPPKGVAYTHANFGAQVDALRTLYNIQPGEIDLCTFPLFALYAPALGMTAVVPKMDFTRPGRVNPRNIIEPVNRFGATNLFGSPALLDRISRSRLSDSSLEQMPSLRRVISAGAPVPASVIERVCAMLPGGVEVFTPYGATESLPVCSIGSATILSETRAATDLGKGVCVGKPVIDLAVIGIDDEPIDEWSDSLRLPVGTIGEICVKGPQVTSAYFNRFEATMLAKIPHENAGFWHRMGDLGYLDDHGRVWFCGRKSQRVVTHEGTWYTIPCESVFAAHEGVRRAALVKAHNRPVICIEKQGDVSEADILAIAQRHEHTRAIRDVLFHPAFPVDIRHNAKIGREALSVWAARRLQP